MLRIGMLASLLILPSLAQACPWQRQHCRPGPVIVYQPCHPQPRPCCWHPQPKIIRIVEVQTVEPPTGVEKPQTPVVKKDADWENWSTLKGRIVWDKAKYGNAPKRESIVATKDAAVAKNDLDFFTEDWVVHQGNLGIKNVVVWVVPEPSTDEEIAGLKKAIADGKRYTFKSFKATDIHPSRRVLPPYVIINIPALRYEPHVVAAQAGQILVIHNSSPVPQNAKWISRDNGEYNRLLPAGGAGGDLVIASLKAEPFPIQLTCSIHPWMKAYVRTFDHPYFTVTDQDGKFEIPNIPRLKGKVRLFIWQETNGYHQAAKGRFGQTIELQPGTTDLKEIKLDKGTR